MAAIGLLIIRLWYVVWSMVRLTRSTSIMVHPSGLSVSTRTVCDILLTLLEKLRVGRTLMHNWFQIEQYN